MESVTKNWVQENVFCVEILYIIQFNVTFCIYTPEDGRARKN